jgi:hypothetical protein
MARIAQSKTLLFVAQDLEASHNVACLRAKDAVVRDGAKLIVVSSMWGELNDFADVWIQPRPGQEAAAVAALDAALADNDASHLGEQQQRAADILKAAAARDPKPPYGHLRPAALRRGARPGVTAALANIAIACAGESARTLISAARSERLGPARYRLLARSAAGIPPGIR